MKILYLINGLHEGGKERRLVELLKHFVKGNSVEMEVVLMSKDMRYPEYLNLGIRTHYLIRRTKKDLRIFYDLYKICKQFKPDVVHTWDSMSSIYAAPIVKLLGIRFVNGMITDAFTAFPFGQIWFRAKLTFTFSDVVVANSIAGLQSYKAPFSKGICIYNGFDKKRIDNLLNPMRVRTEFAVNGKKVVGMVAEFAIRKDYATFILAAQSVLQTRDDVVFIAIGDGPDLERCKSMVDKRYREKIKFLGRQSDVQSIINIMDIGVLTSFREGLSNSILEYMASAKPVVATDAGGTKELVVDSVTGFLTSLQDVDQVSSRIIELLDDPEKARSMGELGRQRVFELFSIETMAGRYLEIYQNLAGPKEGK